MNCLPLTDKVKEVECGHDDDGEPCSQRARLDFRLDAGKKRQSHEIRHRDGVHVAQDGTGRLANTYSLFVFVCLFVWLFVCLFVCFFNTKTLPVLSKLLPFHRTPPCHIHILISSP